ncbi:MAG: ATP synthase F1 subunit gamma [Proteobacteria bacterium]|nr:ATP synthase F1 subunit gamma [Pseudomonadota bacterium]
MASLRDIRRRINSVKNTRKITRAMKLVAAAKMRKAQEAAVSAKPYQETIGRVLQQVISAAEGEIEHPLLSVPENDSDVLVIVISSDRGLCGSFNSHLLKHAKTLANDLETQGKKVQLMLYGRKCINALGKVSGDRTLENSTTGANPKNFDQVAQDLCEDLVVRLGGNRFSKVLICYNQYVSAMVQSPVHKQVLPMKIENTDDDSSDSSKNKDYIYEPSGTEILGAILPMVLQSQILQAFLETEAGEQAARMQAMDNATRNAGELIDKLTLKYNRARQAAITKELIEIISGAEAL